MVIYTRYELQYSILESTLSYPASSSAANAKVSDDSEAYAPHRSLRRSFVWVFGGNASFAFAQFVMTTLVARELGAERLGELTLCLSIATPLVTASSMQLRGVMATDAKGDFEFRHYWGLRLVTLLVLPVGLAISGLWIEFKAAEWMLLAGVGLMKLIEGVAEVIYGFFQLKDRMSHIGIARAIRGFILAVVISVSVLGMGTLIPALYVVSSLWLLVLVGYEIPSAFNYGATWPSVRPLKQIWRLIKTVAPMGGVMVLNAISVQIPIYFLVGIWGEETLGVYTAVAQFMIALTMLSGPMGQVVAPRLAIYFQRDLGAFWRLFWKLQILSFGIGISAMVVAICVGEWALTLVLGDEYSGFSWLLAWLGLVIGVQQGGAFVGAAVTSARVFQRQFAVRLGTTIVIIILSWLFISRYGMWAMPFVLASGPLFSMACYIFILYIESRLQLSRTGNSACSAHS